VKKCEQGKPAAKSLELAERQRASKPL